MEVSFKMDGLEVKADSSETLLSVAKRNNIPIPTLCHHPALAPVGACRLCTVEITKEEWKGWKGYVTSCIYTADTGLIVNTKSKETIEIRKTLLYLLLARCPESKLIIDLAKRYGLSESTFAKRENPDKCILCGRCTRMCEQLGVSAITTVNRGGNKKVGTPYDEPNEECIGCASCTNICPTGNIICRDEGGKRFIWGREFCFLQCSGCGENIIPKEQYLFLKNKGSFDEDYFLKCDRCKRIESVRIMAKVVEMGK